MDIIAFTGSNAVGLSIIASAAQIHPGQRDIKRVIAELGGKNAVIIDDDADLDQAIADTVTSAFGYAGQKCSACSRVYVDRSVAREFLERLIQKTKSFRVGDPVERDVVIGPLINGRAVQTYDAAVAEALMTGGTKVAGSWGGPTTRLRTAPLSRSTASW